MLDNRSHQTLKAPMTRPSQDAGQDDLRVTVVQSMNWACKDPTSSLPAPRQDSTHDDQIHESLPKVDPQHQGHCHGRRVAYWAEKYRSRCEKI